MDIALAGLDPVQGPLLQGLMLLLLLLLLLMMMMMMMMMMIMMLWVVLQLCQAPQRAQQ
jgi:hypothetical protein